MEQRRITMTDIEIGKPLPWDVYDAHQNLLLRKGYVIERINHVQTLIERGLYADSRAVENRSTAAVQPKPSAVRLINLVNQRLEQLLPEIGSQSDVQEKILDAVELIDLALDI